MRDGRVITQTFADALWSWRKELLDDVISYDSKVEKVTLQSAIKGQNANRYSEQFNR